MGRLGVILLINVFTSVIVKSKGFLLEPVDRGSTFLKGFMRCCCGVGTFASSVHWLDDLKTFSTTWDRLTRQPPRPGQRGHSPLQLASTMSW